MVKHRSKSWLRKIKRNKEQSCHILITHLRWIVLSKSFPYYKVFHSCCWPCRDVKFQVEKILGNFKTKLFSEVSLRNFYEVITKYEPITNLCGFDVTVVTIFSHSITPIDHIVRCVQSLMALKCMRCEKNVINMKEMKKLATRIRKI